MTETKVRVAYARTGGKVHATVSGYRTLCGVPYVRAHDRTRFDPDDIFACKRCAAELQKEPT